MHKPFTKVPLIKSLTFTAFALFALMCFLLLQSCKKETMPESQITYVNITNASPTVGTYNFYINNNKINTGALPFGGNMSYLTIQPGEHTLKLTTESSTESLLTKKLVFENTKAYSLFFINQGANLDYLLVPDDLKNPAEDKALIRFINLSPDAPALNLAIKEGNNLFTDKAYKAVSDYSEVEAKVYILQIKDKASGEVKKEVANIDLKKGKTYTIIARGMLTPGEAQQPFGLQVIANK